MEGNSRSMYTLRESAIGHNNFESLLSVEQIDAKIQELISENAGLRNTLQQNNTYMRQLSSTLVEWQEDVVRAKNGYQNEVQKAKEIIIKLKEENNMLKRRVEGMESYSTHSNNINASPQILTAGSPDQIQEAFESLDSYVLVSPSSNQTSSEQQQNAQLPSYNSLFQNDKIVKEFKDTEKSLCQAQRESDFLREQLATEMDSNKKKQDLLTHTQSQLDQLMIEFQELSKQMGQKSQMLALREGSTIEELEELKNINETLKRNCNELEEKLTSTNSRLAIAEEMVLSKQVDITGLQSEIARLEKLLETMPILQAQMELFRTDFEAEREARQTLAGQKDAMEQELRSLKRQLEGAVENSYVTVPAEPLQTLEVETYECPKCSFKYQSNEALNNHLDVCLNQQMYP